MTDQNPLERSHKLLWEGLPASNKGPRPTLTLDEIVIAAITIADQEGLDALSMRRLATSLDMGAMSLYRYVPSKTELLNLMLDRVSGPLADFAEKYGDTWRQVLTTAAWAGRRLYLNHPWLLQVNWTRPVLGPNMVADLDSTMAGLQDLPMSDKEKIMVISYLDGYVTGVVRQEILYDRAAEESDLTDEEFWAYQLPWLERAMASGAYPTMAAMSEDAFDGGWEETFTMGLTHLLDGIERDIERRRQGDAEATRGD